MVYVIPTVDWTLPSLQKIIPICDP